MGKKRKKRGHRQAGVDAAPALAVVAGAVDDGALETAETDPNITAITAPEGESSEESLLPNMAELAALLAQAAVVVEQVTISEEEAEAMLQQKAALSASLSEVPQEEQKKSEWLSRIKSEALKETQRLSSPEQWTDEDLERFTGAKMVTEEYANTYKELRTQAGRLADALEYSSGPGNDTIKGMLERLQPALQQIEADLTAKLNERAEKTAERITRIREQITRVYKEKAERLQAEIDGIEQNLGVQRVLHNRDESARAEEQAARDAEAQARAAAAAAEEARRMEALTRMFAEVQYGIGQLEGVHGQAWKRLEEITGIEDLRTKMQEVDAEPDQKKRTSTFDRVREKLAQAIRSGESNRPLQDMNEIAPWLMKMDGRYGEIMRTLKSELAKEAFQALGGSRELAATRNAVIQEQEIFDRLYGLNPHMAAKKKGAKPGVVYRALAERRASDQKAANAARKAEQEARKKEKKEQKELRDRLLKEGGFEVSDDRGGRGVIQIEETTSKRGTSVVRVIGLAGELRGVHVGSDSPTNLRSFPQWLQAAIHEKRSLKQTMEVPTPPTAAEQAPPVEAPAEVAEPTLSEYAQEQLAELQSELAEAASVTDAVKSKIAADFTAAVDGKTDQDEIDGALLTAVEQVETAIQRAAQVAAHGGGKKKKKK